MVATGKVVAQGIKQISQLEDDVRITCCSPQRTHQSLSVASAPLSKLQLYFLPWIPHGICLNHQGRLQTFSLAGVVSIATK